MAKEICISSTPHETRLAILEDDQLAEIYYERENEYTLAGSIYNGRVTRVLPGMQSAFVDLGLERDAFLYVTDFIELEDQEETDELERAAATGQAPREIQHPHGTAQSAPQSVDRNGGRREERGGRPGDRKQEPRPERHAPDRDAGGDGRSAAHKCCRTSRAAQDREEAGGGRWRGRRRRRGGRGQGAAPEGAAQAGPSVARPAEPVQSFEIEEEPQAHEVHDSRPAPHGHQAPATIVLPGESLSKYGGTPAGEASQSAPQSAAPPRRSFTSKPSTLIDAPDCLGWQRIVAGRIDLAASRTSSRRLEHDLPSESEPAAEAGAATEETVEDPE